MPVHVEKSSCLITNS
uniref:Uncharacterized protein n=1 Tax=Arundo donax TaxID=35708 RepID=A0A0A8ZG56_ARUDO